MASKIGLISNALILIGDSPINSLTGNSRQQQVGSNLYDNIVDNEITKHRWGFARKKAQLSLTTDAPIDDEWGSIYQLPSDLITLIKVRPSVPYQVLEDKVHTNLSGKLTCDYIYRVSESEWPPYFVKMIEYALAKDFATSITDNTNARTEMTNEYIIASRMARYTDSQQHPVEQLRSNPFASVRY